MGKRTTDSKVKSNPKWIVVEKAGYAELYRS